jgi:hypothetical protein
MHVDADNDPPPCGTNRGVKPRGGNTAGIIDNTQTGMGGCKLSQNLAGPIGRQPLGEDDFETASGEVLGEEGLDTCCDIWLFVAAEDDEGDSRAKLIAPGGHSWYISRCHKGDAFVVVRASD